MTNLDPVYVVQKALQDETRLHQPPEAFYQASPGQLLDHVNHRVARLAVDALRRAGALPEERGAETSRDPDHFTGPTLCSFPSSVSTATCDLPTGHSAWSPTRFHRFRREGRS